MGFNSGFKGLRHLTSNTELSHLPHLTMNLRRRHNRNVTRSILGRSNEGGLVELKKKQKTNLFQNIQVLKHIPSLGANERQRYDSASETQRHTYKKCVSVCTLKIELSSWELQKSPIRDKQ